LPWFESFPFNFLQLSQYVFVFEQSFGKVLAYLFCNAKAEPPACHEDYVLVPLGIGPLQVKCETLGFYILKQVLTFFSLNTYIKSFQYPRKLVIINTHSVP